MDPNATLERLRAIVKGVVDGEDDGTAVDEIVELFEALDQWISKGGFLPKDWSYWKTGVTK